MKRIALFVTVLPAVAVVFLLSSQGRAETSIEIQVTVTPAARVNPGCSKLTQPAYGAQARFAAPRIVYANSVTPLYADSSDPRKAPSGLINPTIDDWEAVSAVPLRIRAESFTLPQPQPPTITLHIILRQVSGDAAGSPTIRYTVQSLPPQETRPLPRAIPVLNEVGAPGLVAEGMLIH